VPPKGLSPPASPPSPSPASPRPAHRQRQGPPPLPVVRVRPCAIEAGAAAGRVDQPAGIGGGHPLEAGREKLLRRRLVARAGQDRAGAAERVMHGSVCLGAAGGHLAEPVGNAEEPDIAAHLSPCPPPSLKVSLPKPRACARLAPHTPCSASAGRRRPGPHSGHRIPGRRSPARAWASVGASTSPRLRHQPHMARRAPLPSHRSANGMPAVVEHPHDADATNCR
jgi:hypothetical protein